MAWTTRHLAALPLLAATAWAVLSPQVQANDANEKLWKAHIEPLLKERCLECHNPVKAKSALDLTSLQTMLRGGDRGPAVVPGRPEQSNLYTLLGMDADPHMPPGSRKPFSEEETGLIAEWIKKLPVANANADSHLEPEPAPAKPARRIHWQPETGMKPEQVVDRFLSLAWELDKVTPAAVADDRTFARRLYLDLTGRSPSTNELSAFLAETQPNKRARLVETLLASGEYPRQMREVFDIVLMSRRDAKWEERRVKEQWFAYLEDAFRKNRRWDEVVREIIIARPEKPEHRGATWFLYERENNPQSIAEALAPVTFGVQIKCAQCHDHMVAREIKQAHYWGMVAAFNRSKNVETPDGPALSESAIGGFVSFANLKKESQPAVLTFFNGRKVDEVRPKEGEKETDSPELYVVPPSGEKGKAKQAAVPKFSRRAALADAVTRDNPLLARAMVNRVWAMLMGRGIVHPVDLMDSKHAPSHPELLDWLAQDFERSSYDVKRLITVICNSRAYQAGAVAAGQKRPLPETFAYALEKPISAEQFYRSLLVATGNQPDKEGKVAGRTDQELRRAFIKEFPDLFAPEYSPSLQQAMFLSNSPLFDALLTPHGGNLVARLEALPDNAARVRETFHTAYGRAPQSDEMSEAMKFLEARSTTTGPKQLVWALLTAAEFQLNH